MATTNPRKKDLKDASAGSATEGIEVIARQATFYRAGIEFGHEPKQISLSSLTKQQLDDIKSEPMLITRDIEIDPSKDEAMQEQQS